MSSPRFPGGGASDFYGGAGGFPSQFTAVQPTMNNHSATTPRPLYRSQPSILLNPSSHIAQHQPSPLIGKRTLAEFQTHNLNSSNNNNNNPLLSNYLLRSVKPRTFQHTELSTFPSNRYGLPLLHHLRPNAVNAQQQQPVTNSILPNTNYFPPVRSRLTAPHELEKNSIDRRLQELEKQLLEDNEDEQGDAVSVITTTTTTSEWSHTIQNLITPQKPTSSSPTSSTTSSNSSVESTSSKQSLTEAAIAISEGRFDTATEILTRLLQNSDQRFINCMVSALKSRMNHVECPPPVAELFSIEHAESTQLLFEHSLFFKVARMVANIAILESALTENGKLCVLDFDIGDGNQYVSLLHELSARRKGAPSAVKIVAVVENGADERLNSVGLLLGRHAEKLGIGFEFKVLIRRIAELTRESLDCDADEALAVNFAYKLYRMPDESVSTENPRDELLRRVKALAPRVVTLVEQEANANTAPFVARVSELCAYYGALFDSLESTMARENSARVRIEEGLSRKLGNSVACEGRNRVERCEVFGKWRARMSMAGFMLKPLSQRVAESIKARLGGAGNRVAVKVENGGICFGWMGRTLTVASAWC
ncbi:scarecrow-like protein 8 [Glycine soja]|uniref:Scarecrow-like protein 8 n=1 Tax=Glycine soja TaxID=3848 RepID=A0A445F5S8_GLYSO|nr:scarecrow-like protein 8 [Glycine soja]RZB44203.1 Scarecrow-like protein 8 [Glycine soja]